jgi:hypothetical protein
MRQVRPGSDCVGGGDSKNGHDDQNKNHRKHLTPM